MRVSTSNQSGHWFLDRSKPPRTSHTGVLAYGFHEALELKKGSCNTVFVIYPCFEMRDFQFRRPYPNLETLASRR